MTDKDDFNVAANIMIPIENPEGSQNMIDIQNGEKMSHMEKELELLKEELHQPEQTQHAPTHGQVPPVSLTAVRTVPDLSNRNPTIPTMQQILGAHVVAPYEPHVPPVYAVGAPTFTMPAVVNVPYEGLRKALKCLQVTRGTESLDYDDLCIYPDIDMPVGYKPPKFDIFDGKGDPHAHLRAYCDKLVGKKPSRNFQEYARRWRTEAARVQPPLDESELSKYFIRA
ncbi:hypothetical protein H5410_036832 [Solanum commersonii]|uniref:Uncharacterized protein n=1 Tax=Solanum commersonii TaxID=4109 RepID=A0A9J5Y7Q6_SOLCO|nr:hypothetical protein H5410_036832 [Solanum commersonii]